MNYEEIADKLKEIMDARYIKYDKVEMAMLRYDINTEDIPPRITMTFTRKKDNELRTFDKTFEDFPYWLGHVIILESKKEKKEEEEEEFDLEHPEKSSINLREYADNFQESGLKNYTGKKRGLKPRHNFITEEGISKFDDKYNYYYCKDCGLIERISNNNIHTFWSESNKKFVLSMGQCVKKENAIPDWSVIEKAVDGRKAKKDSMPESISIVNNVMKIKQGEKEDEKGIQFDFPETEEEDKDDVEVKEINNSSNHIRAVETDDKEEDLKYIKIRLHDRGRLRLLAENESSTENYILHKIITDAFLNDKAKNPDNVTFVDILKAKKEILIEMYNKSGLALIEKGIIGIENLITLFSE